MSRIDDLILSVAQKHVDREEESFYESEKNLMEIVRRGYDKWIELFLVLKAKRIGCYAYMVEVLAGPDFQIETNVAAVTKAFARVRQERGVTPALQYGSRQRYSSPASVSHAGVTAQGVSASRERQVIDSGPGAPMPGGLSWELGEEAGTLNGVVVRYVGPPLSKSLHALRAPLQEVAERGDRGEILQALEFFTGFMERVGEPGVRDNRLSPEEQLKGYVGSGWNNLATEMLHELQDALAT